MGSRSTGGIHILRKERTIGDQLMDFEFIPNFLKFIKIKFQEIISIEILKLSKINMNKFT